jgi:hypothetical protein
MISQKALQEFKELWKAEYGDDIPEDFAAGEAINLLTLFDAVYHPIKTEWVDESPKKDL